MDQQTLGQRLRQARLEAGLSGAQLARLIGRSQPYVSDLERGQRTPSLATMQALAEALGKPMSFFFDSAIQETASAQEAKKADPSSNAGGCILVAAGYVPNPAEARQLAQHMSAQGIQTFVFKARWELNDEQLAHLVHGVLSNSVGRLEPQPRSRIRYEDFEDLPRRGRHGREDLRDVID